MGDTQKDIDWKLCCLVATCHCVGEIPECLGQMNTLTIATATTGVRYRVPASEYSEVVIHNRVM